MSRTAVVAFPLTLFLSWYGYVVTRTGSGPGLQWGRIPNHTSFAAIVAGAPYLVLVLVVLGVLYFTRVRGQGGGGRVLLSALGQHAVVFVLALVLAAAIGEWFCGLDERAFRRETAAHLASAIPDPETGDLPLYSRKRWWPGDAQQLVSPEQEPTP